MNQEMVIVRDANVQVGEVSQATIRAMHQVGADVLVEGQKAIIPLAEITWFEIEHPTRGLRPGDVVDVRVIRQLEDGVYECSLRDVEKEAR